MAKRVVRTDYLSKKQMHNAYINYKRRYRAKEKSMKRRGLEMADRMLNKAEYQMVRAELVSEGVTININQTIVSNQQYEYSQSIARQFKKVSEEYDLEWKNLTITQIRTGEIDVSGFNNMLKEKFPEMTGKQRQQWISYEVFGSE